MGACSGERDLGPCPFLISNGQLHKCYGDLFFHLKKKMKRVDMRLKGCVIHIPHSDALTLSIMTL